MTIVLKDAKFNDYWRKVYKRNYNAYLDRVSFIDGDLYDSLELNLNQGINAIIGKNGIGKSNFIRSLYNLFCSENSNRNKFSRLNDRNNIFIDYTLNKNKKTFLYTFEDEDKTDELSAYLFDPCSLIPEIQKIFSSQSNIDELLEGYSESEYNQERLRNLNYLANNNYQKVSLYNLEEVYEEFPILPFFKVEKDGASYDSTQMGLGELSILYFDWLLNYINILSSNKILLIEEPESFLPPIVQKRFINILATFVADKAFQCLISTHSEHILQKIPRSHVKLMLNNHIQKCYQFIDVKDNSQILNSLGLEASKRAVLFFEDLCAKIFLVELISKSEMLHLDNFYLHCSGSESEIINQVKSLPNNFNDFKFIAIFDGDGRGRVESEIGDAKHAFLPSTFPPEQIIINFLKYNDLKILSEFLEVRYDILIQAFQTAEGLDHHDYFYAVARFLGIDFEYLFKRLCQFWINLNKGLEDLEDFYKQIDKIID